VYFPIFVQGGKRALSIVLPLDDVFSLLKNAGVCFLIRTDNAYEVFEDDAQYLAVHVQLHVYKELY
jgi:hypothetical protein